MDATTAKASYAVSGATATAGVLSLQEWALLIGILISVLTYVTHLYYAHKRDKREEAQHQRGKEESDAKLHM